MSILSLTKKEYQEIGLIPDPNNPTREEVFGDERRFVSGSRKPTNPLTKDQRAMSHMQPSYYEGVYS